MLIFFGMNRRRKSLTGYNFIDKGSLNKKSYIQEQGLQRKKKRKRLNTESKLLLLAMLQCLGIIYFWPV